MAKLLIQPTPHTEAALSIRNKPVVSRSVFAKLLPELQGRAFTIAGIEGLNVLQDVRDTIATLPEGGDWNVLKRQIASDMDPYFVDPDADAETQAAQRRAADRRAELLLRTHGQQAYAAAAYKVADEQRDLFPYWQYQTLGDGHVRAAHAALDGIVLPHDHEFWKTHYAPWDWGCRCEVIPLSDADVAELKTADKALPAEKKRVLDEDQQKLLTEQRTLWRPANLATGDGHPIPYSVASPAEKGKPGAFSWHPGDLRLSLADLRARHDPADFALFEAWAKKQMLHGESDGMITVAEWLESKPIHESNTDHTGELNLLQSPHATAARLAGLKMGRSLYGELRATDLGRSQAEITGAELGAVGAGRKPLYHEDVGSERAAADLAAQLNESLPPNVRAAANGSHLIAYDLLSVRKILDSDPSFYRPNGEDDEAAIWRANLAHEQGELMGYGQRTLLAPDSVSVRLITADGHILTGFHAPAASAAELASERSIDYAQGLGVSVFAILKKL